MALWGHTLDQHTLGCGWLTINFNTLPSRSTGIILVDYIVVFVVIGFYSFIFTPSFLLVKVMTPYHISKLR